MLSCRFVNQVCGDGITVCNGSINLIAGSLPKKQIIKKYIKYSLILLCVSIHKIWDLLTD